MGSTEAFEWFVQLDKKSLIAGVVTGQSMKGRGSVPESLNAPQVPAGFPQAAWTAANQRASIKIAEIMDSRTPAQPASGTRPFDEEAFCFGLAVGRSLEGWELDGVVKLPYGWAKLMYYVHAGYNDATVYVPLMANVRVQNNAVVWTKYIDWGDGGDLQTVVTNIPYNTSSRYDTHTHRYSNSGDYVITIISDKPVVIGAHMLTDNNFTYIDYAQGYQQVPEYDSVDDKALYTRSTNGGSAMGGSKVNGAPLKAAYLSGSVEIGTVAFFNCRNLESVSVESDATHIGAMAFCNCTALEYVSLPESLCVIGGGAFSHCESLEEIEIPANVLSIGSSQYQSSWYDMTGQPGENDYQIDPAYFLQWRNAFINASGFESNIFGYSFAFCASLKRVVLPDRVLFVHNGSFYNCEALESVTFGIRTSSIGAGAFQGCHSLIDAPLPDSVKDIDYDAFRDCRALTDFTLPIGLMKIANHAFQDCQSLTRIDVPSTCAMGYLHSDSVYNIVVYNYASGAHSDRDIDLGGSYMEADNIFDGCSNLETATLPPALETMTVFFRVFHECHKLRSVSIPDNVKVISEYAFWNCYALKSVRIPVSVDYIGFAAFYNCNSLTDVYYAGTAAQWNRIVKYGSNTDLTSATIHYESD